MTPSKATSTAVDERVYAVMLGYILAVLSSYCPWYQYIVVDTFSGRFVEFVFLGDWGWAFHVGDLWTSVLFICRQALFFGGLLGGGVVSILSLVFEHRRGSLYLGVALSNIIVLPSIGIPSLLGFLNFLTPRERLWCLPEIYPVGEGFAFGFFASLASVALIFTATIVMLDCAHTSDDTPLK